MPISTFVDGEVIDAARQNANWQLAVLTDTARTISVTHTWTASQTHTLGTATADQPILSATQTWNNAAVNFNAIKVNITNTASASSSMLLNLQLAGSQVFGVRNDARVLIDLPDAAQNYNAIFILKRQTTTKFTVGLDSSDSFVILNSASAAKLTLTDGGALTVAAGITVTASGLTVSSGTTSVQQLTANNTVTVNNTTFSQTGHAGTGTFFNIQDTTGYGMYVASNNTLNFNRGLDADGDFYINQTGYNGGNTRYRSLIIGDGKSNQTLKIDGANAILTWGAMASTNAGVRNICITNGTAPSGNPTGGGFLWVESGALKYRGSSGTVTTLGAA